MVKNSLIAVLSLVIVVLSWFYTEADHYQPQVTGLQMIRNHTPPSPPALPKPGNRAVTGDVFQKGDTLSSLLNRHDIPASDSHAISQVLGKILPVSKLKIGAKAAFYTDMDSDKLVELRISNAADQTVRVVRCEGDRWEAHEMDVLLFTNLECASGMIDDSLWNAAIQQGVPPELILDMADLFGWQVDFTSGLRRGDDFELFYTSRVLKDLGVVPGKIAAARFVNSGKAFFAFSFTLPDGRVEYFDRDGNSMKRTFLKTPLQYRRISSGFSHRRFHPILKEYRPHLGIDYAAPRGTPVSALGDGVVVFCGWKGGYGNYVQIKHGDAYETCYGHLEKFGKGVRKGVQVRQGQVIGYVGSTGLSTGPHLDFRVKYRGNYINPDTIKSQPAEPVPDEFMSLFLQHTTDWLARFRILQQGENDVTG